MPDEFDCEPDNPEIPGSEEIPNNNLDDDCDVLTPDTLLPQGAACDRSFEYLEAISPFVLWPSGHNFCSHMALWI